MGTAQGIGFDKVPGKQRQNPITLGPICLRLGHICVSGRSAGKDWGTTALTIGGIGLAVTR